MNQNRIISMWYNLSRAYEIAKVGNLSISINFQSDYLQGFDDYKLIKEFYNDIEFKTGGDLFIEITKPEYESKIISSETLDSIRNNAIKAQCRELPKEFNPACDTLLKTAINRLNLSQIQIDLTKLIAKNIARLENKDIVRVEHIAEAIQYIAYKNQSEIYSLIDAESNQIQFGKHISIGLFEIESNDIQKAINYLQSLLNKTK
jgi:hypothetical protein